MEDASSAIEPYSSESTWRFCITLVLGAVPGDQKIIARAASRKWHVRG
jgi:hypothetical protein